MEPKISVIILNLNGLNFLKPCLESVKSQTYKNLEIIVTDNASTDGSIDYIFSHSEVVLVKNDSNLGYTGANNKAAQIASGEHLLFLNNDTTLHTNFFEEILKCYEPNSIVSPN